MKLSQAVTMRGHSVALAAATLMVAGVASSSPSLAETTVRQGYQTNMWGMPTYYLVQSGLLEKQGLKVEEFPVPSGNQTMQQMVARQVDLGTYAGPSFLIGHDKGDLVAIAVIENVCQTARVMARADAGINSLEDLKGKKIANQTGSSIGNIFVDQIAPSAGLKPGDYEEVRMNVNDMVAAMGANTVDAMVDVEPYNTIAEKEGIAKELVNFCEYDKLPVFMAATPEFIEENPEAVVQYLNAWRQVEKEFKENPDKVVDTVHAFYTSKGYDMSKETLRDALSKVEVQVGWPEDIESYMQEHAKILKEANKIDEEPDLSKAFRKDFMEKASGN